MLKTLINEPLEAFKLRKKYTRAFDYMFKYAFGKSFGVEIELSPAFYKNRKKASKFFLESIYHTGLVNQIYIIEKSLKTDYGPRKYADGPCHEYTFPVRAQNLHVIYMYLKQIRKLLIGELGVGVFDTSSSMHIHLIPPTVSPKYVDIGIRYYFDSFKSQLNKNNIASDCMDANRALFLKSKHLSKYNKNCYMCHGCGFSILKYIDKPILFRDYLKKVGSRRVKKKVVGKSYYEPTERTLVRQIYRLFYLLKNGPEEAEKTYLHALELMDLKYRDKLAFILGQYDEEKLEMFLDHSIAYFIPYMSEIDNFDNMPDNLIKYSKEYNTFEIRLFAGSTNFSTIMKRALMYNSLKTLMTTSDPTLLNLFLNII